MSVITILDGGTAQATGDRTVVVVQQDERGVAQSVVLTERDLKALEVLLGGM